MSVETGSFGDWAIITVTHNSSSHLRTCWREAALGDAEWLVVDNASSDDSVAVARGLGARVIELRSNLGFSAANNVGLAAVNRSWVAFVNPDVTIGDATGFERLALISRQNDALVAPQLLNVDGSEQPNARGLPFLSDKLAHRSLRLPGSRLEEYVRTGLAVPTYVAWVIGAAVTGPTSLFHRLGGWDERYFVYYEDHDLGLRAWRAGVPVVVDPTVRWTHQWGRATASFSWKPWVNEISSALTFYRSYPSLLLRSRLTAQPWIRAIERARWTPASSPSEGAAVVSGHFGQRHTRPVAVDGHQSEQCPTAR